MTALDASTGARVWSTGLGTDLGQGFAVGDGIVAAVDADGGVHTLDATTGDELWATERTARAVATRDGTVFVAGENGLVQAVVRDGSVAWQARAAGDPAGIVLTEDAVIVATDRQVAAWGDDGSPRWQVAGDCTLVKASATTVACAAPDRVTAIEPDTGKTRRQWQLATPSVDVQLLVDGDGILVRSFDEAAKPRWLVLR